MSEKNVEDIPVVVGTLEYTSLKFKEYVELHFANAIYISALLGTESIIQKYCVS